METTVETTTHTVDAVTLHRTEPSEVRAADCPRRFVLLAGGGVRVVYACGATVEEPEEAAVDVAVLEGRVMRAHAHGHHAGLQRLRLRW